MFKILLKTANKYHLVQTLSRSLSQQNVSIVEIVCLKTIHRKMLHISRPLGIKIEIEYYDSHLNDRNIKYTQSSMPTLLLLPSSHQNINDLEYFIDNFEFYKNYRVLSINFPGTLP